MNTDNYEIYLCLYAYVCGLKKTWIWYHIESGILRFTTTTYNPFAFFFKKASLASKYLHFAPIRLVLVVFSPGISPRPPFLKGGFFSKGLPIKKTSHRFDGRGAGSRGQGEGKLFLKI